MPKILVIGSTNVDFVMRMDRLPARGETVTDAQFLQTFGGKGANTAVSAARTGPAHKTTFITALGDDLYAPTLLANFKADHLDTSHIILRKNLATGSALIMCDKDGANYLSVAPGSNYALTPADIDKDAGLIRTANLVILQMEIRVDTLQRILQLCEDAGVPVLFNFAPVRTTEIPVSSQMTGLVVNEHEASQLTSLPVHDLATARPAAAELLKRGPKFVAITLGAAGVYLLGAGNDIHLPAFKVAAVDTTAAGDTFCGALAVALVEGLPLPAALRFASAASAISVTRLGAQPSIPARAEVDAFLAENPA